MYVEDDNNLVALVRLSTALDDDATLATLIGSAAMQLEAAAKPANSLPIEQMIRCRSTIPSADLSLLD